MRRKIKPPLTSSSTLRNHQYTVNKTKQRNCPPLQSPARHQGSRPSNTCYSCGGTCFNCLTESTWSKKRSSRDPIAPQNFVCFCLYCAYNLTGFCPKPPFFESSPFWGNYIKTSTPSNPYYCHRTWRANATVAGTPWWDTFQPHDSWEKHSIHRTSPRRVSVSKSDMPQADWRLRNEKACVGTFESSSWCPSTAIGYLMSTH